MTTATMHLIEIVQTTANDAPREALDYARFCLLDWLGVTVAGAREPVVECLVADCETTGGNHVLIGRSETADLRDAVMINGTASHALDYDDGMAAMMGHPSVAILPSLVLTAAHRRIDGDRLLRAIIAGTEAAGRIGLMLGEDHYFRGFHGTGTLGAMGGALATAFLMGLDAERSSIALGLAATRAAGLKASFGTDAKPLHAGWAAFVAHTAAAWAEKGMTGATDILGHAQGIAAFTAKADVAAGLAPRPEPLVQTVNFKYHAACAITHPAIDGARAIQTRKGAEAEAIGKITLEVAEVADNICNIANPSTGLELKFSLRGATAMALAGLDTADPGSFSDAPLADPRVRRLIERTDVRLNPSLSLGETRVSLGFADGSSASAEGSLDAFERDPETLRQRLSAKFSALVAPTCGSARTAELVAGILDATPGPDANHIISTFRE